MTGPGPNARAGTARPRRTPVAELFEEAFRLYRRNFVTMVLVFATFQIPVVVVTLPLAAWQAQWSRQLYNPSSAELLEALQELGPFVALSLVIGLAAIVLQTFAAAGVTYLAGRARKEDRPSVREAFLAIRRLAPAILGYIVLVVGGALLLVVGLVVIALLTAGSMGQTASNGDAVFVAVVIGLAGISILAVVVTRLTLSIPVLVLDRVAPVAALRRSWSLVRGSTLRTLGIVLLTGLVISVIAGVATPFYLPGVMEGMLTGSVGSYVLIALVGGAAQTLLGPILPTLITVLYFDYAAERA